MAGSDPPDNRPATSDNSRQVSADRGDLLPGGTDPAARGCGFAPPAKLARASSRSAPAEKVPLDHGFRPHCDLPAVEAPRLSRRSAAAVGPVPAAIAAARRASAQAVPAARWQVGRPVLYGALALLAVAPAFAASLWSALTEDDEARSAAAAAQFAQLPEPGVSAPAGPSAAPAGPVTAPAPRIARLSESFDDDGAGGAVEPSRAPVPSPVRPRAMPVGPAAGRQASEPRPLAVEPRPGSTAGPHEAARLTMPTAEAPSAGSAGKVADGGGRASFRSLSYPITPGSSPSAVVPGQAPAPDREPRARPPAATAPAVIAPAAPTASRPGAGLAAARSAVARLVEQRPGVVLPKARPADLGEGMERPFAVRLAPAHRPSLKPLDVAAAVDAAVPTPTLKPDPASARAGVVAPRPSVWRRIWGLVTPGG